MGVPCIVTDYPGAREVIEDGVTGFVVPRSDASLLAQRLHALAADPALGARMGAQAMKASEHCRTENVLAQWRRLMEQTDMGEKV